MVCPVSRGGRGPIPHPLPGTKLQADLGRHPRVFREQIRSVTFSSSGTSGRGAFALSCSMAFTLMAETSDSYTRVLCISHLHLQSSDLPGP